MKRIDIPLTQLFAALAVSQGKAYRAAKILKCSAGTVCLRMREAGIPVAPRGGGKPVDIDHSALVAALATTRGSANAAARLLGRSHETILRRMREAGIPVAPRGLPLGATIVRPRRERA